ncbi:hypothetical protein ACQP2T_31560 [Nonomuraea sp. CA-143628]
MGITIHASFLPHDDPTSPWPSTATSSARAAVRRLTAGDGSSLSRPER